MIQFHEWQKIDVKLNHMSFLRLPIADLRTSSRRFRRLAPRLT